MAGVDLGEWMVAQGWAVAYYLFSYEYSRAEHRAESARRGIWASEFVKPWEWRRGKQLDTGVKALSGSGGAGHFLPIKHSEVSLARSALPALSCLPHVRPS